MKRISWRGLGISAALAMAGTAALPAAAEAQLFPNLPIRRQRTEPVAEPPFYSHVRQNFYGYYPTCWQKFPDGWACPCPNPEAPDLAAAFKARPRDEKPEVPPDESGANLPDIGGPAAPGPGGTRPNGIPPVPAGGTRSPFELDPGRPGANGNANPDLPAPTDGGRLRDLPTSPPASTAPGETKPMPPAGGRGVDPFEPVRPSGTGPTSMKPSASLPEITVNAGPTLNAPGSAGRPMLELPEMSVVPVAGTSDVSLAQPFPSSLPPSGAIADNPTNGGPLPGASVAPAQAPRRTSVIGGFFDNLGRRRR